MKTRFLERTGLHVSELSLGAAFVALGDEGFAEAAPLIHEDLDLGLGRIVSTTLGPRSRDFRPKNKKQLRATLEESLRLLHRDSFDILMIHEPDRLGQICWWNAREMVPMTATSFCDVARRPGHAFRQKILTEESRLPYGGAK
jgi:aryl-alcohol dehydrogenase-like predicted oxidoreductase